MTIKKQTKALSDESIGFLAAAQFEPQDDIVGFLKRAERQRGMSLELTCLFKHNEICDNNTRTWTQRR